MPLWKARCDFQSEERGSALRASPPVIGMCTIDVASSGVGGNGSAKDNYVRLLVFCPGWQLEGGEA